MHMPDMEKQLAALAKLEANWDSYGGLPICPKCIESARKCLEHAPEGMPNARIVGCSDGGVQLEWTKNGMDLEIEFSPKGSVDYLANGTVTGPEHAIALMEWLNAGG